MGREGHREHWNIIVVGGGIAGLSVAIWARRLGLSVTVLERGAEVGGQLRTIAQPIVDYPGLEGTSGRDLSQRVRQQAEAAGAVIRSGCTVLQVDCRARTCTTTLGELEGDAIVLATGLSPRRLGVPGEDALPAHRPSQEPEWFRGKRVAVIGGGDRAAENALLLTPVARQVCLLARAPRLKARQSFLDQMDAVELLTETTVTAFRTTDSAVEIDLVRRGQAGQITVDAVCIYIGNRPNTDLVEGQAALTSDGYLITDREGLSSVPGLYGVGDVCTAPAYQSLATASGQAMVVAKQILTNLQT